jgi:hypothetical protein
VNILMVDLTEQLLDRFPTWMSESEYSSEAVTFLALNNVKECLLYLTSDNFNEDEIVIFGHRLPDICFAFMVKSLRPDVGLSYVQHGVFKPRLERSVMQIGMLLIRKIYYIHWIFAASSITRFGAAKLFYFLFLSTFVSGKFAGRALSAFDIKFHKVYVINAQYKKYFAEFMGFNARKILLMPPFDALRFDSSSSTEFDVLIIAQTFVEDGRMGAQRYKKKLEDILARLLGKKVGIFLHPRSEKKNYSFCDCDLVENSWKIPSAGLYLSDYSTLSLVAHQIGLNSALIDISNHDRGEEFSQIPKYIQ